MKPTKEEDQRLHEKTKSIWMIFMKACVDAVQRKKAEAGHAMKT